MIFNVKGVSGGCLDRLNVRSFGYSGRFGQEQRTQMIIISMNLGLKKERERDTNNFEKSR